MTYIGTLKTTCQYLLTLNRILVYYTKHGATDN